MKKLASELRLGDTLKLRLDGRPCERPVDRVVEESHNHVRVVLFSESGRRPSFTLPGNATVEVVQPPAA